MSEEPTVEMVPSPASMRDASSSSSLQGDIDDTTSNNAAAIPLQSRWSYRAILSGFAAIIVAAGVLALALRLPFVILPDAATKTFEFAYFSYDPERAHFDNSAWTYGTDYVLAVVMAVLSWSIWRVSSSTSSNRRMGMRAASLYILYMTTVTIGGMCHQIYTSVESLNTLSFRILWTLCVLTIPLGSISMGLCASEIVHKFQRERLCSSRFDMIPLVPDIFWWVYGLCVTAFAASGRMSFHRPACDFFVVAVTQSPPTFYMVGILFLLDYPKVKVYMRVMGVAGFTLNTPLLPIFPLLIQHTDWTLGNVNTLLHLCLTVTWSMEAIFILQLLRSTAMTTTTTTTTANNNTDDNKDDDDNNKDEDDKIVEENV